MAQRQGWEASLIAVEAFFAGTLMWSWPIGVGCAILTALIIMMVPAIGYAVAAVVAAGVGYLGYEMSGAPAALAIGAVALLLNVASVIAMTKAAAPRTARLP